MKKVTPNGTLIKKLRGRLERGSLQKEMAYAVHISERMLRLIENKNAAISIATLDMIASYVKVPSDQIAYAIGVPKLVSSQDKMDYVLCELFKDRVVPRFDKEPAYCTMDEARLIYDASHSEDLTVQIDIKLTGETSEYAEELIRMLTPLTRSNKDYVARPTSADGIALAKRVRQLLVLLKGNDVWLYYTHHMRHLPERYELPKHDELSELKFRVAIVFGPPGKYGEESVNVEIDNGQPYFFDGWKKRQNGG